MRKTYRTLKALRLQYSLFCVRPFAERDIRWASRRDRFTGVNSDRVGLWSPRSALIFSHELCGRPKSTCNMFTGLQSRNTTVYFTPIFAYMATWVLGTYCVVWASCCREHQAGGLQRKQKTEVQTITHHTLLKNSAYRSRLKIMDKVYRQRRHLKLKKGKIVYWYAENFPGSKAPSFLESWALLRMDKGDEIFHLIRECSRVCMGWNTGLRWRLSILRKILK